MKYEMKVKEVDDYTDYPLNVLSGLTGLGEKTILQLVEEGKFSIKDNDGTKKVNGKDFLDWARTVDNMVEVEKTDYHQMKVDE